MAHYRATAAGRAAFDPAPGRDQCVFVAVRGTGPVLLLLSRVGDLGHLAFSYLATGVQPAERCAIDPQHCSAVHGPSVWLDHVRSLSACLALGAAGRQALAGG